MSTIKTDTLPIKGWCVITNCLGGSELVWRILTEDGDFPEIYNTEREAQEAIVNNQIEHMQEFLTHDREYNDIDWEHEYKPYKIEIDADGKLEVFQTSKSGEIRFLELITTLTEWRENL